LGGDLELQRRRQRGPGRGVDQPLRQADRDRRAGQQLLDQLGGRRVDVGSDAVGEAEGVRVLGADDPRGHDQLLRAAHADDLGQARGAAEVGDEPEPCLRKAHERVLGQDAQVAGQGQLQRAAQADAVDLADDRLGHLLREVPGVEAGAPERAQLLGGAGGGRQRGDVHAGGEHGTVAAEHDAAHGRVVGGGTERGADGEHQVLVERVALLGTVEDDVADRLAILGDDEVGHSG
jgi:hypothetical protein